MNLPPEEIDEKTEKTSPEGTAMVRERERLWATPEEQEAFAAAEAIVQKAAELYAGEEDVNEERFADQIRVQLKSSFTGLSVDWKSLPKHKSYVRLGNQEYEIELLADGKQVFFGGLKLK